MLGFFLLCTYTLMLIVIYTVSHFSTDVNELLSEIRGIEPLITDSRTDQVKVLIKRLQDKLSQPDERRFYLFKVCKYKLLSTRLRTQTFVDELMFLANDFFKILRM